MRKTLFGIFLVVFGVIIGFYIGFWLLFIGGLVPVIRQYEAGIAIPSQFGLAFLKVFFTGFVINVSIDFFILPGVKILKQKLFK